MEHLKVLAEDKTICEGLTAMTGDLINGIESSERRC